VYKRQEQALEAGMERQIAEIREQAETAMADHQKGESEVAAKLERIGEAKTTFNRISTELTTFIEHLENGRLT